MMQQAPVGASVHRCVTGSPAFLSAMAKFVE